MICPKCKSEKQDGPLCSNCGFQFWNARCSVCHKWLDQEWISCPACHNLLKEKCPECGEMEWIGRDACETKVREHIKKRLGGRLLFNKIHYIVVILACSLFCFVPFFKVPFLIKLLLFVAMLLLTASGGFLENESEIKIEEFAKGRLELAEILKKAKGEKEK